MLTVNLALCTGCRRCETACSFFHSGRVSNRMSRIRVLNIYEVGVDAPMVCGQCRERYCIDSCPEGALSIGADGQVMLSPTKCRLCGVCEMSCPIGAIEIHNDIVYVCDLCGGDPKCIPACTEDAITWTRGVDAPVSLARVKDDAKGLNPSERRFEHAMRQATDLRKEWLGA